MALLLLIHPETGNAVSCRKGEGALARSLILDGYNPIGPRGQAAAAVIRAQAAAVVKVYAESVREAGPRDRNGASSYVIGERSTLIYEGDKEGAEAALRALPVGESVAVRHAGGIRSCMNKPALWEWVSTL